MLTKFVMEPHICKAGETRVPRPPSLPSQCFCPFLYCKNTLKTRCFLGSATFTGCRARHRVIRSTLHPIIHHRRKHAFGAQQRTYCSRKHVLQGISGATCISRDVLSSRGWFSRCINERCSVIGKWETRQRLRSLNDASVGCRTHVFTLNCLSVHTVVALCNIPL